MRRNPGGRREPQTIADSIAAAARDDRQRAADGTQEPAVKHRLGILFVHGIGEQPEGETLLGFGEPVIAWLRRWVRRRADPAQRGDVAVVKSVLTPSKLQAQMPPHAEVLVTLPQQRPQSWLIAESWWGGDVQRPGFGKVAGWMMTVGAWSILSHLTKHIAGRKYPATRFILRILALVEWIVLASLLQLTIAVLSLFTILPIPGVRNTLAGILLALTGVLGDSYVLLESDLQRSAIVDKTHEALEWLAGQCESVVVIAHSQGAAIAHRALRTSEPPNVRMLVTFGSGLGKLEELLRLHERPGPVNTIARLAPVFPVLFALLVRAIFFEQWDQLSEIAVITLGVLILFSSMVAVIQAQQQWSSVEAWLPELKLGTLRPGLKWVDLYAASDPVSNGPLSPLKTRIATAQAKLRNLGSFFGDHTSYWQNRVQFVTIVARVVARCANIPVFTAAERDALRKAALLHDRHVGWLSLTLWGTLASIALLPVLYWQKLEAPGAMMEGALRAIGGPAEKVLAALHWIITSARDGADVAAVQRSILGTLVCGTIILLWRRAYFMVWRAWDNTALERVMRPGYLAHPVDRFFVDALAVLAGFAPLLLVIGWPLLVRVLVGHVIASVSLVLVAGIVIGFAVGFVAKVVSVWRAITRSDWNAGKELLAPLGSLASLLLVLGVLLPKFVNRLAPLRDFVLTAFVAVANVGLIVALHRAAFNRLAELTKRRSVHIAAMVLPGFVALLAALTRSYEPPIPSLVRKASDLLFALLGVYFISGVVLWFACWLMQRWRRRAQVV